MWSLDADQDGYAGAESVESCTEPESWSAVPGDCDDGQAAIYPGAPDSWYDGVDSDCAGNDDADADADGHPWVEAGGDDCDDQDAEVYPGASDTWYDGVDGDCGGESDFDADADGHDAEEFGGDDCDDAVAQINPGALEQCGNGLDDDCDDDASDCVLSGEVAFEDTDLVIEGEIVGEFLGKNVALTSDLDLDGEAELLYTTTSVVEERPEGDVVVHLPTVEFGEVQGSSIQDLHVIDIERMDAGTLLQGASGNVDFFADGTPDLAVSATQAPGPYSAFLLVYSSPPPLVGTDAAADWTIVADERLPNWVGPQVAALGQVEGPDAVALGAMYWHFGGTEPFGAIFAVESGGAGIQDLSAESPAIYSTGANSNFGQSLDSTDLDGDGILDLVVGCSNFAGMFEGSGAPEREYWPAVGVYFAPFDEQRSASDYDGLLADLTGGEGVGIEAVQAMGDVDEDGVVDFAFGSPSDVVDSGVAAGRIWVVSGALLTAGLDIDGLALGRVDGTDGYDHMGWYLTAGDINGDDRVDLVSGGALHHSSQESGGGRVFIMYGGFDGVRSTPDATLFGPEGDSTTYGKPLASGQDLTGDGCDEIAMSDYYWPKDEGQGLIGVTFGSCP